MRIEAMQSFVTLVKLGSYPAAAEQLFLSPTTVHGHIRGLEDEVGAPLAAWNGRKLELTRAGSRFYVFAERTLSEYQSLERDISGIVRPDAGRLRVVSLSGPSIHLIPRVVHAFQAERPDLLVTVQSTGVGQSMAALVSGEADIAITNDTHSDEVPPGFEATTVHEDNLVLVVRADEYEPPDIEVVRRLPVALQAGVSPYRQYLERWARREDVSLRAVFEHSSFDGLLTFLLEGGCVAMMGQYVARLSAASDRLHVLDLPNFQPQRRLIAIHPRPLEGVVAEFVETFRRQFLVS